MSYNLDGYTLFGSCNDSYRSGGVCVYVESHLNCSVSAFNLSTADIIRVDWTFGNDMYVILGVYRLYGSVLDIFLREFSAFIGNIKSKNLFIVGDINIDILNFPTNCDEYLFLMSSFGLESLLNVPTRVTSSSATCIDHFFARLHSNDLSCLKSSAIDLMISDHHLIEIVCSFVAFQPSRANFCSVNKPKLNLALLKELSKLADWNSIMCEVDPSVALDVFYSTITKLLSQCYKPVYTKKVKLLQPWISRKLATRIQKRYLMLKKVKMHPSNLTLLDTYKHMCKAINIDVKREKVTYYINQFSSNGNDVKKNWKLVNELLTKKPKSSKILSISSDKGLLTDEVDIANEFISYFTSIAEKLRAKFLSANITTNYDLPYDSCSETFFMTPVSNYEVLEIIGSLEPKDSLDSEGISNNILKAISNFVSPALTHIFNLSFEQGVVPMRFKTANVIPIFKNGTHSSLGNYRPIALQPVLLKVIEKAVKNRVMLFLDRFGLLSAHQHGFRQKMSTESALLEFLDVIHNGLNSGKACAGLFIDVSKAFDTVDHNLLLSIMFDLGFRGVSNNWFRSYLDNRKIRVKHNDCFSDFRTVDIGVPQGSVLGPLLFLIFSNSIFKLNLNGKSTGFADDLALAYTANSPTELISMVNSDLIVLRNWFCEHRLILSEKTKFMWFKTSGIPTAPDHYQIIYHSGSQCSAVSCLDDSCFRIESVNCFRYLGIYLDTNLNWKMHITNLKSYVSSASRVFYLLRNVCPLSVLKMMFHALVMAKLEYGLSCWGGCYSTTSKPLCVLQKMILRIILNKNRLEPSWPLFQSTNILPLQHLYVFKVLRIFYKRSGQRVLRCDARFNLRVNNRLLYKVPNFNNELFRRYVLVSAPAFFNALPESIRRLINLKTFLPAVRVWLSKTPDIGDLFCVIT